MRSVRWKYCNNDTICPNKSFKKWLSLHNFNLLFPHSLTFGEKFTSYSSNTGNHKNNKNAAKLPTKCNTQQYNEWMNGPWSEAVKKWAKILYKSQQMLEKQKQMNIQIRNKVNVEVEEVLWKKCNKCLLATTQCSAINTAQGRNVFISRQSERQGIVFSRCGTLHLWIMNWKLERRFFPRYHLSCNFHSFSMAIFSFPSLFLYSIGVSQCYSNTMICTLFRYLLFWKLFHYLYYLELEIRKKYLYCSSDK